MNTFGRIFRLTSFGESHGLAIGGVIDGVPSGLEIDIDQIQAELNRRRPGQSSITTQRKENDKLSILSGVFEGKTIGTPIGFVINNSDCKSGDYDHLKGAYRPSHADYTYSAKYGIRDHRGGGRASARETACRIVGGAIARQILNKYGIKITAFTSRVGDIVLDKDYTKLNFGMIEESIVRCPDPAISTKMIELIDSVKNEGDSIGGIITCVIQGVEPGIGSPIFGKLNAQLASAMLSINAAKGIEFGMGFEGVCKKGSEMNDKFVYINGEIRTSTNHSGGIQGGISNGEDIIMRIAFKPIATLMQQTTTVNSIGEEVILRPKGRHDACVLPRAVPIVEAMAAMVILDNILISKTDRL